MQPSKRTDHALIAVYGDTDDKVIAQAISLYLPGRDIRILEPDSLQTLEMAALNSVLTFIAVSGADDSNLALGQMLHDNNLVVGDVIAFCLSGVNLPLIDVVAKGFDGMICQSDVERAAFKQYLAAKINKGMRRLNGSIQAEEYRRLSDALSIAPVSMIVFDADKRAVFVSDHYFRAYPRIAPRLIRGLRVYDAFKMMAKEEGMGEDDPRYAKLQHFWYNMNGNVEFTLDDGKSYRLKAVDLPNKRGTVITGQNISGYVRARIRF